MAQKIQVALSTYLISFSTGQTGLRTPPYTQYSTDLDTNFVTLRNTINQLIDEVAAIQGPNAGLGLQLSQFDDPARAGGTANTGRIGEDSYRISIGSPTSEVDITAGTILLNGLAVVNSQGATLVGSGGAGTRFIAIDSNGVIYQETLANQRALDIGTATWNGTAFTAVVNYNSTTSPAVPDFFDGDEYERQTIRAVSSPTWTAKTYTRASKRIRAIERLMAGVLTDEDGAAIGPMALADGTAAAPSLVLLNNTSTGFYRAGAGLLGISVTGTARYEFSAQGLGSAQNGSAGSPAIYRTADPNTGLYWTGTADELAIATAGAQVALFDATGNLDLPLNSRVKGVRSVAQSIADNTATLVSFTAADAFDIGTWHNAAGGAPGDQEFTVPSGGDGLYAIVFEWEWASPTNITNITMEITVDGTPDAAKVEEQIPASVNRSGQLTLFRTLTAAQVVRARVTQDDTGGAGSLNLETAALSIVKVA